ncbi:MAG: DUF2029 domain-containing protein [Vicinamibacteria bacterium]|nr:DUF2029 domain-containing protein [Vicinamibacteria bacterium]
MRRRRRLCTERSAHTAALIAACVALVLLGRALSKHSIDYAVYHQAARSLLAGRTDLYAGDFALQPPMRYVYPPLFVMLVAPLGRLTLADGFGLWFALSALTTLAVARAGWRAWNGRDTRLRLCVLLGLAGPFVVYGLRSGNVHLPVVMLATAAIIAWSRRQTWRASLLLAFAGAIKVFPLFLLVYFTLLRQWRLVARAAGLSVLLWLLPVLQFGPRATIALYRHWHEDVASNIDRLRLESRLDVSIIGAGARWLGEADYAQRIDRDYPQINLFRIDRATSGRLMRLFVAVVWALSLAGCIRLGRARGAERAARSAGLASLWMTTQLLVGPYTTLLYLCGWLVPALALPCLLRGRRFGRSALIAVTLVNLALILVPGSAAHRAIEAAGAHTVLGLCLWILSLTVVFNLSRRSRTGDAQPLFHRPRPNIERRDPHSSPETLNAVPRKTEGARSRS